MTILMPIKCNTLLEGKYSYNYLAKKKMHIQLLIGRVFSNSNALVLYTLCEKTFFGMLISIDRSSCNILGEVDSLKDKVVHRCRFC